MTGWLIVSAVGLALAVFTISLAWAIVRNLREGRRLRQRLARRLEELRLQRLMWLNELDPDAYLHRERLVDVSRHMQACAGCTEMARCDQALEEENPQAVASYCPNYDALQAMRGGR